jgi:DNA topoisomerase IB
MREFLHDDWAIAFLINPSNPLAGPERKTTLKHRHVAVDGNEVRFRFTGKSGKQWSLRVRDRRIGKIKPARSFPVRSLSSMSTKKELLGRHIDRRERLSQGNHRHGYQVLNSYMDGNLVLELKSKAESALRSGMEASSRKRSRCSH